MIIIGGFMKIKKDYIELFLLFALGILLIAFSAEAKAGAKNGAALCDNIIIPSLLPVLMIFNIIMKTGAGRALDGIFSFVTEKIFRLPRCAGTAIVFGLIGGYPTGALLTESLFDGQDIDDDTARRMLRFNVNGGAAFIITAVGMSMLKSQKAGLILFASTTFSAIVLAALSSLRYKKITDSHESYCSMSFGEAMNFGVESALKGMLKMSAYIIVFSAVNEIIKMPKQLSPFIEITNGLAIGSKLFSLPELAFLLSFAGFCIHFQLFSIIKKVKMKYFDFLFWRIAHAVSSYFCCFGLTKLLPTDASVFSNVSEITSQISYISPTFSALMILACAVLIFDIDSKRKRC